MKLRALVLLAIAASAFCGTALAEPSARSASTAIGIEEDEYTITAYRRVVKPGVVRFNIENIGEDAHNLVVIGPRGHVASSSEVKPGDFYTLRARLRRTGTYHLLCTQADHLQRGMTTRIRVRR
jgi:plastocyanin